jgi:hypothetical protein
MNPSEKFALSTLTFDAEHLIQICGPDGKVLVTVGEPSGPGDGKEFHVWEGEGTDEDGDESTPYVKILAAGTKFGLKVDDLEAAWVAAMREGFGLAITIVARNG